ncbi:hypothetical protein TUBRATIS_19450 [Tubulinosema ratisbonensis]|uniref:Uncharacterized protein n=1 Tax=Tubulinosema ratisbonensis TaxID=291195 RepID=A0A437AKJ2_9MICR|nr:hypothetical protein TUBRATIS_19450 [Tubulinosema ratisbonensis]
MFSVLILINEIISSKRRMEDSDDEEPNKIKKMIKTEQEKCKAELTFKSREIEQDKDFSLMSSKDDGVLYPGFKKLSQESPLKKTSEPLEKNLTICQPSLEENCAKLKEDELSLDNISENILLSQQNGENFIEPFLFSEDSSTINFSKECQHLLPNNLASNPINHLQRNANLTESKIYSASETVAEEQIFTNEGINITESFNQTVDNICVDASITREKESAESNTKELYMKKIQKTLLPKTFSNLKIYSTKSHIYLTNEMSCNFVRTVYELEDRYFFRFHKLYKCIEESDFPGHLWLKKRLKNLGIEAIIEADKINNFFDIYIKNKKLECAIQELINDKEELVPVINQFNTIFTNYIRDIKNAILMDKEKYLRVFKFTTSAYHKTLSKENLYISLKFFLENEENSIFVDMFPEIVLFLEELKTHKKMSTNLIRYDIFLNLIVFKFIFFKKIIKKIVLEKSKNSSWLLVDSDLILNFIFEMRCTFAIFGYEVLSRYQYKRLIIFRTFVTFLKLLNSDVVKYTGIFDQTFLPYPKELSYLKILNYSKSKKN